jgi:hypothetical protein
MVYRFGAQPVFATAAFFAERLEALVAGVSQGLKDGSSNLNPHGLSPADPRSVWLDFAKKADYVQQTDPLCAARALDLLPPVMAGSRPVSKSGSYCLGSTVTLSGP